MGLAVIDMASCYAAQGQPCDYCVVKCPLGKDAIRFDADKIPVVDPVGCTGCGVCAYLCPAPAIHIDPATARMRTGDPTSNSLSAQRQDETVP